jgi:murein DD-endopeptidase MepM/ murein hydrolase activator NlpD
MAWSRQLRNRVARFGLLVGLLIPAASLYLTTRAFEAETSSLYPLTAVPRFNPRLSPPDNVSRRLQEARVPMEFTMGRGETLMGLMERLRLPHGDAWDAAKAAGASVNLRTLRSGSVCRALFAGETTVLASLEVTVATSGQLRVERAAQGWQANWHEFQRGSQLRVVHGVLDGSLEASIRRAGGPPALATRIAETLRWDIDFHRDLRRGDEFSVMYRELQLEGNFSGVGDLVAVVYNNGGRIHEAYRYSDSGTYYDGEGRPLRAMFLRAPLRYTHVTSSFSENRFHPVLHENRPHYGVDYAAVVGTPVEVTADGVVTFAGWDGGGGNVVKVRHAGSYESAYLHLSRFAHGIRPGSRVRQGDVIAYTGATGLATGPHLDYRVKYRDQWINPMLLATVRGEAIPMGELAAFRAWRGEMRQGMAQGIVPAVASQPLTVAPANHSLASASVGAR